MGITSVLGASALLPAGLGFRNKIINGGFDIWQRGTSFSANGSYTADRWLLQADGSGATRAVSQQTFTAGNQITGQEPTYFLRYSQSVAGTGATYNLIDQRIEDVRTLAGQQISISFWAKASATTTISTQMQQVFGSGGSAEVQAVPTQSFSLTSSWVRYTYTTTMASISGKTIGTSSYAVFRINFPLNSTFTVDIWGVQVEANYQPTTFEQRPYGVELALCKRYFWRCVDPAGVGVNDSNVRCTRTLIPFHTEMRSAPTSVVSGTLSFWNGGVTGNATGLIGTFNTKHHGQLDFNGGAGVASGPCTLYTTGGSQYIDFNSEL